MIPGAVLAAGRSSRMGRSKALLPFGSSAGVSFLQHILDSMNQGGVADILVVGRPEDQELIGAVLQSRVPARFIANPNHVHGQLTSIVAAVNAVDRPGVRGLLVTPVDMPLIHAETFAALLRAASEHSSAIVRAMCAGRHGHPVIFDRSSFDALRHADPSVGAKSVLQLNRGRVREVKVPDEGVLKDIDSLEDYVSIFGRPPESFKASVTS
jgi:molybdenum cofactor cytidylyltransferase